MIHFSVCLTALLLATFPVVVPAPARSSDTGTVPPPASTSSPPTSTSAVVSSGTVTNTAPSSTVTVPFIKLDPNRPVWDANFPGPYEGIRGSLGATIIGPHNPNIEVQNPDFIAPPSTDSGRMPNFKWPLSLSRNRLQTGGWARQQNEAVMPIASAMAGVNMRLKPGAIRELHWHKTAEWAYVMKGYTQITAVDADGKNFISTVGPGDLWYFPAGIPHSLQATADDPDGSEFLLVFDSGAFSEDSTFMLTDWLAHVPAEVLEKNFQLPESAFAQVPAKDLYIFPADAPPADQKNPESPSGTVDNPFSFALSKVPATQLSGGSVRIVDSTTFKVSTTIAAAEVTVEPGAIRELHWHPTQDEWTFFLEGEGRVTIFAGSGTANTVDFQAGDIAYVPASMGHYVENIGNTTLKFIEIFNSAKFQDISLNQWLALIPPNMVKAHIGSFSDEIIAGLPKTKQVVVGPSA